MARDIVAYFEYMVPFQQASASQLTRLRKLQKRKYRREYGLFLAEGHRTVLQIVEQGALALSEIFVTEHYLGEYGSALLPGTTFICAEKEMRSIADADTPQGIVAVCAIPEPANLDSVAKKPGKIVAFDRIQDPGNMGTIIRTAAWFGIDLLMIGEGSADIWNPKVVRSTAGATGSIAYAECDLSLELERFSQMGWRPALLDGNSGSQPIEEWDPGMRTILVVGNEANGVSPELAERFERFRIDSAPGQNAAESLNASIAAGIALYVLTQKSVNRI
jgi:RNA methyltransferase, TrmH family